MSAAEDPDSPLAAVLAQLTDLRQKITALDARMQQLRPEPQRPGPSGNADGPGEDEGYTPDPAPQWWQLDGVDRDGEIARLAAWVDTVFRPGYGHLAAKLGACWQRHDLCLYYLSWLSEIHTVVFMSPDRMPSAEADWHVRLLPVAAALLEAETELCDHLPARSRQVGPGADPFAGTS